MDRGERTDKNNGIAYIRELKGKALDKYRSYLLLARKHEARKKTVEWLSGQENVKDAGISEDGQTLWIIMENGVELNIIIE